MWILSVIERAPGCLRRVESWHQLVPLVTFRQLQTYVRFDPQICAVLPGKLLNFDRFTVHKRAFALSVLASQ